MPKITSSHYQRISENTRCVAQLAKLLSKSIYPNLAPQRGKNNFPRVHSRRLENTRRWYTELSRERR